MNAFPRSCSSGFAGLFLSAAFSSFRSNVHERRRFGINFIFSTARGLIESWKGRVKKEAEKERRHDGEGEAKQRKRREGSSEC